MNTKTIFAVVLVVAGAGVFSYLYNYKFSNTNKS